MDRELIKSPRPYAVVVNDDGVQLNLLSALVREVGLEPRGFATAEAALTDMSVSSGLTGGAASAMPALVITDIYMPGIDGWRFCRLLRSPEYAAFNEVPIVVVSAFYAGEETDRIASDIGAEAFIPSPVDGACFVEQVRAILKGRRAQIGLRALIVDDNEALADLLQGTFIANDYKADIAPTVRAAADAFKRTAYDVIVLDYHLPDGTGDTLLDAFRAQRPDCVCIMMTTDSEPELALDWMKQGAAAYLHKPFQADYLIELCGRARRERALLRVQDLLEERTRELRESEAALRSVVHNSADLMITTDQKSIVTYVSPQCVNVLGQPSGEFIGHTMPEILHPDDAAACARAWQTLLHGGSLRDSEYRITDGEGRVRWVSHSAQLVEIDGRVVGTQNTIRDTTERKLAEEQLRRNLEEKEVLLREVHHRVKNNLTVISSLLHLQSNLIQTPEQALAAFQNSMDRIMSMALVHEELYKSRNYARVDMGEYLEKLTSHLLQAHGSREDIHLSAKAEGIVLSVNTSIPCGLILNELITNAFKHAFPNGRSGDIHVLLQKVNDEYFDLSVWDNGIGLPEGYDLNKSGSLGLTLVQLLTEQLEGNLDISTDNGTRCHIRFTQEHNHEHAETADRTR
jgi:PAS domain S-box-containing protein